ncbi:MAG TPA: UvrD-helicase domain-containing protein, partial [Bacillota bacterium]
MSGGGVRWTDGQRQAIETRGTDLLVSAGAGAGKTAVLVERIITLITDPDHPVDVDRLLVVTFTEAAAAEMRDRIARRLSELLAQDPDDQRLAVQLALLPRADISTLHAFCLRVCRRHFHLAGMDPSFRVLDENEAHLLRFEVLDEVLERRFAAGDPPFLDLARRFGGRGGEGLAPLILRIHEFAATQVDPDAWLDQVLA